MGAKDKNTIIDPELQKIQEQEKARVAAEAAAAKAQRTTLDNQEIADLTAAQTAQTQALKDNNETLYKNQGEIIKAAEDKWNAAKQKDETARRRENAFRYISGLGDTLSGVANLIGTAHGASNQNQKYNSHAVVQKAEEARKARKLDIESQSKRLDELSAQLQNLKAAGSLKEAELAAAQMKEMAALKKGQRTAGEAEDKYYSTRGDQAVQAATSQFNANRNFEEQQRQFDENQKRLADNAAANRKNQKEIAEAKAAAELAKQQAKNAADPKHQAKTLQANVTGVRDELARKMGYADYNEYLRYKNVSGWGSEIDGQRNSVSKRIRNERASKNPETEEFLNLLRSPESMTEEQVRMLMSASNVFAEAVNAPETEPHLASNGKKKVW